jgi:hypothetical protein
VSNTVKRAPKTLGEANAARMANPLVAAIVGADDIKYEDVEVPEWPMPDGSPIELRIRGLSGKDRDEHEARMFMMRTTGDDEVKIELAANRNARILVKCLYDPETDERLPVTEEMLGAKSGPVVSRLAGIALRLSGLGRDSVRDAGKGSSSDRSEGSTSD